MTEKEYIELLATIARARAEEFFRMVRLIEEVKESSDNRYQMRRCEPT